MEQSGDFAADCRRLFAPEHGRRWKTAAAAALAIARTTLYRYLSAEQPVPVPIRARLAALAREPAKPYSAGRIFLGDEKMTPEQHIADASRPFTGAEYIESLKDGREVYINGERVRDVTTHPAFRNSVRSLARLYDALHEPERKDVLTCPTDTGSAGFTHRYFRVARSPAELKAQQVAIAEWAPADLWLDGTHARLQGGADEHARRQRRVLRPVRRECARLVQARPRGRPLHEPRDRQPAGRSRPSDERSQGRLRHDREGD